MKKLLLIICFLFNQNYVWATSINPLDDGGWSLVSHMSNSGGMFDGNGELNPDYEFGTFDASPSSSTSDFSRVFPFQASEILFITGDLSVWGITDYNLLHGLIDDRGNDFSPNLAFEVGINGTVSNTTGNVLSRNGISEDPWISIDGSHQDGISNQFIVWGESNYSSGSHQLLKNTHGGLNVYIRGISTIPEPSTLALLSLGLAGFSFSRRKKKA